jgi:carbon monoxide dehydrogenase subunit G
VRASGEIVVERPPPAVWGWATDPRHWHRWQPALTDVSGTAGVGDRITARDRSGGKTRVTEYEVVESTPPRRQVVRAISEEVRFEGTLELAPDVGGTRLRYTVDAGPDDALARFVFAVARPLVRRGMRLQIEGQLARIKEMAELEAVL